MKYRRLGSKWIRVHDLHDNKLKLTYNDRTQLFPIKHMSDALTEMIKELVFEGTIQQNKYDQLSADDRRTFYDILKMTHIQHSMPDPLKDPNAVLSAEYQRLRGEILSLGNANPDWAKKLRLVALDMYGAKLISDHEFQSILATV